MKILCIIPPYIPSYFNAGHHLAVFQVAEYLRQNYPNAEVTALDAAGLQITWKEICDLLVQKYDLIALMNDFDGIDTFKRFITYKDQLSPKTKIITFGRLSKQIPRFFLQYNIDAIHFSGDFETGILDYLLYLKSETRKEIPGVLLKEHKEATLIDGRYISSEEWAFPDIREIPYLAYNRLYQNDFNKFCGIPERTELVVPVARGCSIGCSFCDVPIMQGKRERRFSVERTIKYIQDSFEAIPFEYVSFYAPTFTLNHAWVNNLCHALNSLEKKYPWKCTTALSTLSEDLILNMASSGCIRISLGIETFTESASLLLPKAKQNAKEKFIHMVKFCNKNKIELNCFIILGLPEDNPETVKETIHLCSSYGARVRPTIYTPFNSMKETMSPEEVAQYNRQTFVRGLLDQDTMDRYYDLFYANKSDRATQVNKQIKERNSKSDKGLLCHFA